MLQKDVLLSFPHFDELTHILEWIFKVEKSFNYHHTPYTDKVDIVLIHFEKK